ncbi:MAG: SURF1 family protein [Amaricoccus sp.]
MTRRMIVPLLFGILGVTVLVWLGVWQVHRLAWKTALLAEIDARLAAAPVSVPPAPDPDRDRYLHVAARGEIAPGELDVYTSVPDRGVGYRIVVPLVLDDGRKILLDRGFVPIEAKDTPRRLGPIAIEGTLAWPDETDRFTPEPDRTKDIWFARDVPLMADALGTLPVMLVTATSDDPSGPMPLPQTVDIPNNHLQYAITWFGLAMAWTLMTGYLLYRIKRRLD